MRSAGESEPEAKVMQQEHADMGRGGLEQGIELCKAGCGGTYTGGNAAAGCAGSKDEELGKGTACKVRRTCKFA
jgi:hypothetical protein